MNTLVKSSAIYTFGSILRQVVSFLMLPIYTRHLTPADYGIVEMLTVVTSVLALIAGTHIGMATIRFYHAASNEAEQKTVLSTATFTILLASGSVYLLFLLVMQTPAGGLIASSTLGDAHLIPLMLLFSLTIILQPIEEQMFTVIRLQNRPWRFIVLSMTKLVLQLTLNISFVVVLDMKVRGVVYGSIIASGTFAVTSFIYLRIYSGWQFSPEVGRKIVRFIIPLMIGAFGTLFMSISDRYILQNLQDSTAVGLYALGARFADILMVIGWWPFINVWQTYRFEISKSPDAKEQYRTVFAGISLYLIWISLGIAVLTDDVLQVLSVEAFWPAAHITPPLLVASLLNAAVGFCSFSFLVTDRTGYMAKGTWVSAIILVICYFTLVPPLGATGTAWSRVAAAGTQLAVVLYWSRNVYPMNLPWRTTGILLAMAAVFYELAELAKGLGYVYYGAEALLLAAYPLIALYTPILPQETRTLVQDRVRSVLGSARQVLRV
jgi:O-antigen/teichoic acid export membrane protein